jgi:tetratricopeptide (TPR) repeat protein
VASLPAAAQAVRGEATLGTSGWYARLVIRLSREVDAQVRLSGGILVVHFARPVDVAVDRINLSATDWIGAARRDPDGRGLRFALARKVRVNTIAAGERLYIDLLPESWTGDPPGLPQEVVEDLARRAREAERIARQKLLQAEQERKLTLVRVRVAKQPTFTRYVFELPELTGVNTDRGKDRLRLMFAAPLKFEMAEAKLALPAAVASIDAMLQNDTSEVRFAFSNSVDVRTFREDFNYVVDVTPLDPQAVKGDGKLSPEGLPRVARPAAPQPVVEPPATVPAKSAPEVAAGPVMPNAGDDPAEKPATAPATRPASTPPPVRAETPRRDPKRPVAAEMRRHGDNLRVLFPFVAQVPAAVFQRADVLWLVFDTAAKIDIVVLENEPSRTVRSATVTREGETQVVRLKLERPRLVSAALDGTSWLVTIGEAVQEPTRPLTVTRNIVAPGRTSVTIAFDDPQKLHRLSDPEIGDMLMVVTGLGPARGLVKTQDFVEFRALAATHGVVIQSFADDLSAELSADKLLLSRPGGLTLSEAAVLHRKPGPARAVTFDSQLWSADRAANFSERQGQLIRAAAEAPFTRRSAHRLDLARFYLSRQMFAEAKAVLDIAIADDRPTAEDPSALVLRAVSNIMLNRVDAALKDLGNAVVGNQNDAQLWRALAHARQGKWSEARDGFRYVEGALGTLPLELQRIALLESLRALIEVGDFAAAVVKLNDFETIGVPPELEPVVAVLTGRLAERMGRTEDALASYRFAADSWHRPMAAQGRLRELALRYGLGEAKKTEIINDLEILTTAWRGDETELEALRLLARFYTEENRYRDAFHVMRTALTAHPHAELTRRIQDEASQTFDTLFLAGKGDALPAIDALGLFYDFRDLAPIGRRGDDMIRRLADRLVSVDLLDQAAELLQHQVDNRLQGAARAQVATKLAVVYLLNHKPDRAQAALRATRTADLSNEVRNQRLLIEARAISDVGRHDLALEVIANVVSREATRLRSDIHWAARRWQQAAEHIELLHVDRAQSFEPLSDLERSDILRAGIGYALAEDKIGLARLREKFSAKMTDGADRRAFEVATGGLGPNSAEFREVARIIASVDTLEGFLRDMRVRYPDMSTASPSVPQVPDPNTTGAAAPRAALSPSGPQTALQ